MSNSRPAMLEAPERATSDQRSVRLQSLLLAGAALTAVFATALSHTAPVEVIPLLAVQGLALAWALTLHLGSARLPDRLVSVVPTSAVVLATASVSLSGDATSGFVALFIWASLHAFMLPTPRTVALHFGLAAAGYLIATLATAEPAAGFQAETEHLFLTFTAVGAVCGAAAYMRSGVDRLVEQLSEAEHTDGLTGLLSRPGILAVISRDLARAQQANSTLSVVALDFDRFKQVNERCGAAAGDRVLRAVADLLCEASPKASTVGRSGSEDFLITMPGLDEHRAFLVAEELLTRVRSNFGDLVVPVTASAGVASAPAHGIALDTLLRSADQALHAAKVLGGDRSVIFSPEVTGVIGAEAGRRSVETQAQLATVLGLAEALDLRDSGTARHSQTVGRLCELMARELALDETRVQRVRLAGVLHDIGKIGVPDAILRKPGPLNTEELEKMRRHPELGARILSGSELDDVRGWVLAHHERPDGRGYPAGLTEESIPIEAAILAVGDAYEAMTSDRVYRMSIGIEAARQQLLEHAGTQFDHAVVEALLRVVDRDPALVPQIQPS